MYRYNMLYVRERCCCCDAVLSPLTYLHKWCQVIIGLGYGLASIQRLATTWTNTELLPMGPREKFGISNVEFTLEI